MWLAVPERVMMKSPVRENRPPGSVRGAPGNRRPYRDPPDNGVQMVRLTARRARSKVCIVRGAGPVG